MLDDAPRFLRRLDEGEEVEVAGADHAFLDQRIEIDDAVPEFLAEHQHRERLDLAGLDQGKQLESLVEGAEGAGEDAHRAGAEQEVHLAQSRTEEGREGKEWGRRGRTRVA